MDNMKPFYDTVDMIFDFDIENPAEESALACLVGGNNMYRAILKFKDVENGRELAANFIRKISDISNALDLLGNN